MDIRASGASARSRSTRCALLASAGAILAAGIAVPVSAGTAGSSAAAEAQLPPDEQQPDIIVTAPRFRDARPERDMDEAGIASYGLSTVDELIAEIQAETGDDEEPVFVINGERIYDLDEIGAYPVEVLRQLQVLPRGSATRFGGSTSQRVISMALHKQMRSATLTLAPRIATEGNWRSGRGENLFTYVRGQTRANVALRIRDEGSLLESERGIIQPEPTIPHATSGNIIGYPDLSGEIDPILTEASGTVVTMVPVPANPNPGIADFAAEANSANVTDLGRFRTLRPSLRNYDLNGSYSTRLTPWLTSTATLRIGRSTNRGLLGLPAGLFTLDPDNLHSPFSTTVALAVYGGPEALRYRSRRDLGEGNLTLNASFGKWRGNLNAKHSRGSSLSLTDRSDQAGAVALADDFDPFGAALEDLVPVRTDRATSRTRSTILQASLSGSPLELPAGPLQTTVDGRLAWNHIRSRSNVSGPEVDRSFNRSARSIRTALEVPLTSRSNEFLEEIGDLSASGEYGIEHFSDAGGVTRYALGLIWEPRPLLRLRGAIERTKTPAAIEFLGDPVIATPDVRLFDPITGETVDVVQVTGGNSLIRPQTTRTTRLSALLRLVPRLGLQLNGELADIDERDFVSGLPAASTAVMLAFPDRFIRDDNGVLTRVDLRPVNFEAHRQTRLRYGLSLSAPLGGRGGGARVSSVAVGAEGDDDRDEPPVASSGPMSPPTRLQLTANHTVLFKDEIRIRPGLDPVNLLEGGAIGIAGGRLRHQVDATAAVTSGGTGVRLGAAWRGGNVLESRTGDSVGLLSFSPVLTVNLRTFADMRRLLPGLGWSQGTRVSLNVLNLTNRRQHVRDPFGDTPLQYQPGYRDPLGRTVEFELRRVF